MRLASISTVALVLLMSYTAFPQQYSYSHYDITEGLAGSTVYCITQDADGYIWVGTETGLSRFDGTHFKNFTTSEGLPDIEVLQIFGDSKGRVWMAPFRKSLFYYYKGVFHTPADDSMLRMVTLYGNVEGFAENASGDVLIAERAGLHLIGYDGTIMNIDSIHGRAIRGCAAICRSIAGNFLVQEGSDIWELVKGSFVFFRTIDLQDIGPRYISMSSRGVAWREKYTRSAILSFATGKLFYRPIDTVNYRLSSYYQPEDSVAYINESSGSVQWSFETGKQKVYLPGAEVSRAFRDRDGNLWFTTMGQGLYRLNSEEFRTITIPAKNAAPSSVFSIRRIKNNIWVGTDRAIIDQLAVSDYEPVSLPTYAVDAKLKILYLDTAIEHTVLIVSSNWIERFDTQRGKISHFGIGTKCVLPMGGTRILIGNANGVFVVDYLSGLADTIWRERATAINYDNGSFYIGTLSGLYRINKDRSVVYMGKEIGILRKTISSLVISADHTLWVGFYDDVGIVGIRHDSVIAKITSKDGLTSDICRTMLIKERTLWVGTDKGLNAIRLDPPGHLVRRYTSNDGLGSNMVNTIYADGSMIYVGTAAGLSFFDVNRTHIGEPCGLKLQAVINSGRNRIADTGKLILSHRQKDIRFEYAGISYRSAGDIRYRYRLLGLDSTWRETREAFLDYPSLPSGSYSFELQAINKFDTRSFPLSIPFEVETPFWETLWFKAAVAAAIALLTWLFVDRRIRYIRRQQQEKAELQREKAEMENKALQSQMNPHFIFNCLNSIQHFMFDKNMLATNDYISGFARLIRATLHYSSRSFITINEEVEYLSTYLSLEKMRFEEKMSYSIEVDTAIDRLNAFIPPMMIQPYVENAMRHGLRHKEGSDGFIRITIRNEEEGLLVSVEDNGIGRLKAMEYKTGEHIEYQSKGMSLTASRIGIISAVYGVHIRVHVEDRMTNGRPDGTRVTLVFPNFSALSNTTI
jgi:ligand-binding sensor domain-containing protein